MHSVSPLCARLMVNTIVLQSFYDRFTEIDDDYKFVRNKQWEFFLLHKDMKSSENFKDSHCLTDIKMTPISVYKPKINRIFWYIRKIWIQTFKFQFWFVHFDELLFECSAVDFNIYCSCIQWYQCSMHSKYSILFGIYYA